MRKESIFNKKWKKKQVFHTIYLIMFPPFLLPQILLTNLTQPTSSSLCQEQEEEESNTKQTNWKLIGQNINILNDFFKEVIDSM